MDFENQVHNFHVLDAQRRALQLAVSGSPLHIILEVLTDAVHCATNNEVGASISLVNSDRTRLRMVAQSGVPDEMRCVLDGSRIGRPGSASSIVAVSGQPVMCQDLATDPLWRTSRDVVLQSGFRSAWSMPIKSTSGRILGTFGFYARRPAGSTQIERETVELLSHTAAIVIEREHELRTRAAAEKALVKSEAKLAQEARSLARLHELTSLLLSASDQQEVTDQILNAAQVIFDGEGGVVQLYYPNTGTLKIVGATGLAGQIRKCNAQLQQFIEISQEVASTRQPVTIDDLNPGHDSSAENSECVDRTHGIAMVPILTRKRSLLGVVSVLFSQSQRPTTQHFQLMELYLRNAVAIIERIRSDEATETSRRQAERQRRLYETIFRNSVDFIYVFDLNHQFTYANDALLDLWGMTWEEAAGKSCLELGLDAWHAERHDQEIEQVIRTKMPIRGEIPYSGRKGERIFDYIFFPVLGINGEVEAVAGMTRDITNLKYAQSALQEADRRKDEFLAMLGHELRNPLAGIVTGTDALALYQLSPEADEIRELMVRQARHMSHIVDDLLDVSRIARGKLSLRKKPVNLRQIVAETIGDYRRTQKHADFTFRCELPEDDVWIEGDATRLSQILTNILHNSVKFSDQRREIDIRLLVNSIQDRVCIEVIDYGIGMTPDMLDRVFQPFCQADNSVERSGGGLGLGMALVKGLVELHGGEIDVYSEGLGQGTQTVIRLPQLSYQYSETETWIDIDARPLKVLLIDDCFSAILPIKRLLEKKGHGVLTAEDGPTGLELAKLHHPDAILCDLSLDEQMNGFEVASRVRQAAEIQYCYLVAVSGYGSADDRRRAKNAGFDFHLTKPVGAKQLDELLSRFPHFESTGS